MNIKYDWYEEVAKFDIGLWQGVCMVGDRLLVQHIGWFWVMVVWNWIVMIPK